MKDIVCTHCGSNELIERNGFFECEYCDTKYTIEEINKLRGVPTVNKNDEDDLLELIFTSAEAKNWTKVKEYATKYHELAPRKWKNKALFYFYSIVSEKARIGITAEAKNFYINTILPLAIEQTYASDKCIFAMELMCRYILTIASKEINYIRRNYVNCAALKYDLTCMLKIANELALFHDQARNILNKNGGVVLGVSSYTVILLKCNIYIYSGIMKSFSTPKCHLEHCEKVANNVKIESRDNSYQIPVYTTYEQSRREIMKWGFKDIDTTF